MWILIIEHAEFPIPKFDMETAWGQVFNILIYLKIGAHHKKDHIKISQFTKFGVVLLDCNHV